VAVESVGKASAAAARSAKKRSNSDDVKDSWSPCPPGCNTNYIVHITFDIDILVNLKSVKKRICNLLNLCVTTMNEFG